MLKNIANKNSFFPTLIVVAAFLFCFHLYGGGERSKKTFDNSQVVSNFSAHFSAVRLQMIEIDIEFDFIWWRCPFIGILFEYCVLERKGEERIQNPEY